MPHDQVPPRMSLIAPQSSPAEGTRIAQNHVGQHHKCAAPWSCLGLLLCIDLISFVLDIPQFPVLLLLLPLNVAAPPSPTFSTRPLSHTLLRSSKISTLRTTLPLVLVAVRRVCRRQVCLCFPFPSPLPLARLIEYLSWTRVKLNSLAWSRQRQAKITQLFPSLSVCMSSPRASYTRYGFPSRVLGLSEPRPSLYFPSFRADSDLAPFNVIPPSCRRLS